MKTIDALVLSAALLLVACSPAVSAQQQPEQRPLRFDFTPFFGYRTSMSFSIEPHVSGMNPRVVLDASPSFGGSFGVRLQEDGLIEVRWARQDSYFHSEDVSPALPRQRVILDQYHGDFSREFILDEWRPWARPFVLLSVGATRISNRTNVDFTRFSFGIGGGIRFYPSQHIGFKIQAEWLPVLVDPQVALICGAGCTVHVGSTAGFQGEVLVGPVLRF
jgi:hypothetical protein